MKAYTELRKLIDDFIKLYDQNLPALLANCQEALAWKALDNAKKHLLDDKSTADFDF